MIAATPEYIKTLVNMHKDHPDWGDSGHLYAPDIYKSFLAAGHISSILDYGCGKCTLWHALVNHTPPVDVQWQNYDPALKEHSTRPLKADLVVCTDVLEHVEHDCIDAVLLSIFELAQKGVYLAIACYKAQHILPDGRNAHLIVERPNWWIKKINALVDGLPGKYDIIWGPSSGDLIVKATKRSNKK